ncbi:MAG: GNAT family N-acetyltransferase [Parachlamydiaceae bacterium]|nr:GNAT family N-acetyltransferase [Parachlamydiaceae bacterium]
MNFESNLLNSFANIGDTSQFLSALSEFSACNEDKPKATLVNESIQYLFNNAFNGLGAKNLPDLKKLEFLVMIIQLELLQKEGNENVSPALEKIRQSIAKIESMNPLALITSDTLPSASQHNENKRNYSFKVSALNNFLTEKAEIGEIAEQIKQIALDGDLSPGRSVEKNISGDPKHFTLIAIDKDNVVGGYISGEFKEKEGCFEVNRLAVTKDLRSEKGKLSEEKIGTRLMLKMMKKAHKAGMKTFYLEFDPKSTWSDRKEYIEDCERRCAFYQNFSKYGVKFNSKDSNYYESDGTTSVTTQMTYQISNFTYNPAALQVFYKSQDEQKK